MTRTDRVHTNNTHSPSCTSNDVVQNVRLHTLLLTNEEATLRSYCPEIHTPTMRYKVDYPARYIPTMRYKVDYLARYIPTMCYKAIVCKTHSNDALAGNAQHGQLRD